MKKAKKKAISKVKEAKLKKEKKETKTKLVKEAEKLAKDLDIPVEDAIIYLEEEEKKKSKARKRKETKKKLEKVGKKARGVLTGLQIRSEAYLEAQGLSEKRGSKKSKKNAENVAENIMRQWR